MSTMTSYSQYIRWNNSSERDVVQISPDNGASEDTTSTSETTANATKRAALRVKHVCAKVAKAYCEARVRDPRFSSALW